MEHTEEMVMMLNQIPSPAFFVQNGIIIETNPPAQGHMVHAGDSVYDLLNTGVQEYADFHSGCLYLTVNICGRKNSASVTRMDQYDLFVLEHEDDMAELQSMALAAQELRAPLSTVMTMADRLFPLIGEQNNEEAEDQVSRINRGLYQMLRIISNMSDAYRYAQEMPARFEIRDICSILDEVFLESAPLIQHTGIDLHFENLNERIFGLVDAEKLERAVHNILSNALKFTPTSGKIDARLTRRKNMLYLTVQNNCAHASATAPAHFYNQYLRKPGLGDSRFGIGLGMVLIHSAAAAHGGTVLLETTPENCTRITMSIAIRQSNDPKVRASIIQVDYAGERDHRLVELSDSLPANLYRKNKIN